MEKKFEFVDAKEYAKELIKSGARTVVAKKTGSVIARVAEKEEKIDVWTKNGNHESPEIAEKGDVILTRVDEDGKPVIDEFGHTNTWKVSRKTFEEKYDTEHPDPETGTFKPAGGKQTFIEVDRDITFMAPWESRQKIVAGGFLNITDQKNIYGIAREEFLETYKILEERN